MPDKFVLATHNPAKLKEMRDILSALGLEVLSPEEAGVSVDVEETGETFAENAMLKAKALCEATGLPAIGDDSGLCADALNGGPGVYSARYGGEHLTDAQRNKLLLESVKGQGTRNAHFICAIACVFPDGDTLTAEGRCDGVISYIPMGTDGFGYDPVFNYPPKLKTFAQMTPEEKAEVSHRGKALRTFADTLGAYLSEKAWKELEEEKNREAVEPEAVPEAVETETTPEEVPEAVETETPPEETPEAVETETTPEEVPEAVETETPPEEVPEAVETEITPEAVPEAVETETPPEETPEAEETAETEEKSESGDAVREKPKHHVKKGSKKKKRKKHH